MVDFNNLESIENARREAEAKAQDAKHAVEGAVTKRPWRTVAVFLGTIALLVGIVFAVSGCAAPEITDRKLTAEEDARVAKACAGNCVIVPGEVWQEIQRRLALGGSKAI